MEQDKKSRKTMLLSETVLAVLCAAGIAAGTVSDIDIARAVHSPDSILWRVITIAGMYPYMAVWVLYMGVICRQVRSSDISKGRKTAWTVVCFYLGLSTSVICSWAMFASDTIGGVFPETIDNPPIIAAGAVFGVYPLFFLGLFTSKKEYDKRLLKRLITLCAVMLAALCVLTAVKIGFSRPRYRLLIQEIPGLEFQPWYIPFAGAGEFINGMGIDRNDFRSFPSGHALQSMGLIFALPPLAEVYGCLGGKKNVLFGAAVVFAVLVCASRMVMGAHFLGDVSMGSLLAVVFGFIWFRSSGSSSL